MNWIELIQRQVFLNTDEPLGSVTEFLAQLNNYTDCSRRAMYIGVSYNEFDSGLHF
jgi:hypothetical protein